MTAPDPTPNPTLWIGPVLCCGVPDPDAYQGVCGLPIESEPCPKHKTTDQEAAMPDQPNLYRERAHLVAHLATRYFSAITYNDPNEPDWPVIYIETPAGQLSWHLSPDDLDLFEHVIRVTPESITWDGHSTEEKYQRLAKLTREATSA